MKQLKKHPILCSIYISGLIGLTVVLIHDLVRGFYHHSFLTAVGSVLFSALLFGIFIIYPLVLTLLNLYYLFQRNYRPAFSKTGKQFEYITLLLGSLYSLLLLFINPIDFQADWNETLTNRLVHTPIWTKANITIFAFSCIGIAGYLILSWVRLNHMPPLVIVCAISGMYLGLLQCVFWIVQIFSKDYLLLCLLPLNAIIIVAKTVRYKVIEWNTLEQENERSIENRLLNALNQKLMRSSNWPIAAFLLMWPLLGILIAVLALFGQHTDSIIKAWTNTSDWNLSQQTAPPNIYYDEHYLCTVAAGGHRKIVKPLRMGVRHGHSVIVNRQLCIANAFEQILEENIPVFHRHVRSFYDKYGFPVARMIHSPYVADFIYILMKPLEWIFLLIIYFCDVLPENRIAVQYLPK